MTYKLVRIADGKPVEVGKTVVNFQGAEYTITYAIPPHKAGSAGKVVIGHAEQVNNQNKTFGIRELYATAVGLQWLWIEEDRDSQFPSNF